MKAHENCLKLGKISIFTELQFNFKIKLTFVTNFKVLLCPLLLDKINTESNFCHFTSDWPIRFNLFTPHLSGSLNTQILKYWHFNHHAYIIQVKFMNMNLWMNLWTSQVFWVILNETLSWTYICTTEAILIPFGSVKLYQRFSTPLSNTADKT